MIIAAIGGALRSGWLLGAGVTPIYHGQPQPRYRPGLDLDGDGITCES